MFLIETTWLGLTLGDFDQPRCQLYSNNLDQKSVYMIDSDKNYSEIKKRKE